MSSFRRIRCVSRQATMTTLGSLIAACWLIALPASAFDRSDVAPQISQLAFTAAGDTLLVTYHYDDKATGKLIGSSISEMRVADGHITTLATSCDFRYDEASPSPDGKLIGVIFSYTGSFIYGPSGAVRRYTGPQVVAVYPRGGFEGRPLWVDDDGKTVGLVFFGDSADDLFYVAKRMPGEAGDGRGDNLVHVNLRSGEKKVTNTNLHYVSKAQLIDRTHAILLGRVPEKAAIQNLSEFPDLATQPIITDKVILLLDLESGALTFHQANRQINRHNRLSFGFSSINYLRDGRFYVMSRDISLTATRGSHIGIYRDGQVEYFRKLDGLVELFRVSPDGRHAAFPISEKLVGQREMVLDRLGILDLESGNVARLDMTDDRFLEPVAAKCPAGRQAR